jgi:hypothetical protein
MKAKLRGDSLRKSVRGYARFMTPHHILTWPWPSDTADYGKRANDAKVKANFGR